MGNCIKKGEVRAGFSYLPHYFLFFTLCSSLPRLFAYLLSFHDIDSVRQGRQRDAQVLAIQRIDGGSESRPWPTGRTVYKPIEDATMSCPMLLPLFQPDMCARKAYTGSGRFSPEVSSPCRCPTAPQSRISTLEPINWYLKWI